MSSIVETQKALHDFSTNSGGADIPESLHGGSLPKNKADTASPVRRKCSKRRFSKFGAQMALLHNANSRSRKRLESRMYWCVECRSWHLTKSAFCVSKVDYSNASGVSHTKESW